MLDYAREDIDPDRVLAAMNAREIDSECLAAWLPRLPHAIGSEWLVLLRAVAKGFGSTWAFNYPEVLNPSSQTVMTLMQNNQGLMEARRQGTPSSILVSLAYNFRIVWEIQHAYYCFVQHHGRDPGVDLATIAAMYISLQMYDDVVRSEDEVIDLLVKPLLEGRSIEAGFN